MHRVIWRCAAAALLLCADASGSLAAPTPNDEIDAGDSSPLDCWTMPDGCPARTGACATSVPRGPLERAWTYQPREGVIASEPLVWKRLVVVPFADGFDVLDLASGQVIVSKRRIAAKTTAVPVVGPGFVLARTAPDQLTAFSIDIAGKSAKSIWTWKSPSGRLQTEPLVWDRDVFVYTERDAFRLRVGSREPILSSPSRDAPGELAPAAIDGEASILGGSLCVATSRDAPAQGGGTDTVLELDFTSLTSGERATTFAGIAPRSSSSLLRQRSRLVGRWYAETFLATRTGAMTADGSVATTVLLPRQHAQPKDLRLLSLRDPPILWRNRWLITSRDDDGGYSIGITIDPASAQAKAETEQTSPTLTRHVLSSSTRNSHIVDAGVPATAAADAILVGPYVFDPESGAVLHELPVKSAFRTVPARSTLLVVEGDEIGKGTRLVAFRPARKAAGAPTIAFQPAAVAGAAADQAILTPNLTVVRRDGGVRTGVVAFVPGADSVSFPPPPPPPGARPSPGTPTATPSSGERWPLAEIALIADANRKVLHAGDPDDAIAAMRRAAETAVASEWFAYAMDASKRGDVPRARVALAQAEARGAADADVWKALSEIDAVESKGRKPTSADQKALAARDAAVRAKTAGTVWSWSQGLPADAAPALVSRLARLSLDADPSVEGPSEWVRAHVPAGIETGAAFATRDWLVFLDALRTTPVRLVEVPTVQRNLTNSQRQLGSARATWRKDLVAFESRRAVVITPVARPGRIARCLATAELVCRTLESIFETYRRRRAETDPLVMLLYDTKEEYVARAAGAAGLEWSLGHYSPDEGMSKLYVPDGDAEFASVAATFAHELTHHWMDLCCPAFSDAERVRGRGDGPGYWIEEGFARFIEEGIADLDAGRYELSSQTAGSIDVVANASPGALHLWPELFEWKYADFRRLAASKETIDVPTRWKLGINRRIAPIGLFYAQAGAAVRYLYFAEDGHHRRALLGYIADFHANRAKADSLSKALGMSYADLGVKIAAWCRERQRRPAK